MTESTFLEGVIIGFGLGFIIGTETISYFKNQVIHWKDKRIEYLQEQVEFWKKRDQR